MKKIVFCLIGFLLAAPSVFAGPVGSVTGKIMTQSTHHHLVETIVYLKDVPNTKPPKTVTVDQKKLQFLPHMIPIVAGDSIEFSSHDPVVHDVFVHSTKTEEFTVDVMKPNDKSVTHAFPTVGTYKVTCHYHAEMLAYIFVGSNPYMATVDSTGQYTINDVPPGTYQLAVWNPQLKAEDQSVTVTADKPVNVEFTLTK